MLKLLAFVGMDKDQTKSAIRRFAVGRERVVREELRVSTILPTRPLLSI